MVLTDVLLPALSFLPAWFISLLLVFIGIILALVVFKIVAFILDSLPFM